MNRIRNRVKNKKKIILLIVFAILCINISAVKLQATEANPGSGPLSIDFNISAGDNGDVVSSLQILFILTIIALAPSIILMTTSFTRIIVVLHFLRSALGTQQTPPNQVLIGLTLFITFFIMSPVLAQVNQESLQPFQAGQISQQEAIEKGIKPLADFMKKQVQDKDVRLFMDIASIDYVETVEDIPLEVLIPAFLLSELRIAFIIGFMIYIPFIVIDMVIASTLMSMGMMMLPPVMISLPFKLLLFVAADGWTLIIGELVRSFY